eukprot:142594_1
MIMSVMQDKKQVDSTTIPSLKHQRPIELLKTCIILFICESPNNLSFPLLLTSFVQKIKSFIGNIPTNKPYLTNLLTIESISTNTKTDNNNPSYTLNQIITSSKSNELSLCIKQILLEIACIKTHYNTQLLILSKIMNNNVFIEIFPENQYNKIAILNCNISSMKQHFNSLLSKIDKHKNNYFENKLSCKPKATIPKKRTWHELPDEDLLFSSNFYYPLSKRRRMDMDDNAHNQKILQRIPLSINNNNNKTLKDMQNVVSDLLDYKSHKNMSNCDLSREAIDILRTPSTREILIQNLYSTKNNNAVNEFCTHGTKHQCKIFQKSLNPMLPLLSLKECNKIHFIRIMRPHTIPTLGDCSYLDGCRHMDTCRFIHYIVDEESVSKKRPYFRARKYVNKLLMGSRKKMGRKDDDGMESDSSIDTQVLEEQIYQNPAIHRYSAQWINCDVRALEFGVLNKYGVIMADPPWDIHMELPYGTLTDEEMLTLGVGELADDNCLLFLWVTGRVMELARKCMERWGFECQEEILWIKTNQLQRIIRTGRTGHWLNHSKEHCLVGVKGNDIGWNRCLDCDTIVAEVRETSRKPDEIYNVIERLSPGTEKIEMFGRQHNTRPGWMTLGNQLNKTRILDDKIYKRFKQLYPTIEVDRSENDIKQDDDDDDDDDD